MCTLLDSGTTKTASMLRLTSLLSDRRSVAICCRPVSRRMRATLLEMIRKSLLVKTSGFRTSSWDISFGMKAYCGSTILWDSISAE